MVKVAVTGDHGGPIVEDWMRPFSRRPLSFLAKIKCAIGMVILVPIRIVLSLVLWIFMGPSIFFVMG